MLHSSWEFTKVEMIALLHAQMLRAQVLYAKMLYIPVVRAQPLYAQVLCAQGLACVGPVCRSPPRTPKLGKTCLGWEKLCSCLLQHPKPFPSLCNTIHTGTRSSPMAGSIPPCFAVRVGAARLRKAPNLTPSYLNIWEAAVETGCTCRGRKTGPGPSARESSAS